MNELSTQYKTAAELNQKIIFTAQMAQQNLFKMCCMLKRMRDEKLYKELGYPNFEDYCEIEVGISRHMAYKYTDILEIKNVESIQHFGITKLSLLASLSESQQEEIQQNVNVEDISVRKLKEEIARLKEESESAGQRAENERQRRISAETDLLSAKSKNRSLTHDLDAANSRINELEHQPITVVEDMQVQRENERLRSELEQARETITEMERTDTSYELKTAKAAVRNLDRQLSELAQESANEQNHIRQKYQKEINALREQLENSAYTTEVETVEVPATREVFEAYCSIVKNAYAMLIEFVKSVGSDKEYTKAVDKMLDTFEDNLCDIM